MTCRRFLPDLGILAILIVGGSILLGRTATEVYDFFDMSAFMDAGYRVSIGQRPYADFYFQTGPVHLYLHALFYKLFGFGKWAILAHLLTVNALFIVATYVMARRSMGRFPAAMAGLIATVSFYGPIAHPWYDQNAALWLAGGMLMTDIVLDDRDFPLLGEERARVRSIRRVVMASAVAGALATLAFFTKTNSGVAGGAALCSVLFLRGRRRLTIPAFLGGAVAVAAIILLTLDAPGEYVYQAFLAYRPGGRILSPGRILSGLRESVYVPLGIAALILAAMGGWASARQQAARWFFFAAMLAAAFFATYTGSMDFASNRPLLAPLSIQLWTIVGGGTYRRPALRSIGVGVVAVLTLAMAVQSLRLTHEHAVWQWHPSNMANDYVMQNKAMKGWRCNREIGEGVDAAVDYIRNHVPETDSLFVFPDATVIYGLTGRPSWKPAPFLFHKGHFPLPGRLLDEFRIRLTGNPPDWIVLHDQHEIYFMDSDALLDWLDLRSFLENEYAMERSWNAFRLYRRSR